MGCNAQGSRLAPAADHHAGKRARGARAAGAGMSCIYLPIIIILSALLLLPLGCTHTGRESSHKDAPVVRVRILQNLDRVNLTASAPPLVRVGSSPNPKRINYPANTLIPVALTSGGWTIGNVAVGTGELTIEPATDGSVYVNGHAYRGKYRLVPVEPNRFDVVNDVDVDGYLKGVVPREMLAGWDIEAYKAQAIVARTYAIYVSKREPVSRWFDLYDDQRSQVYGGIAAETPKSREAVDATSGVVVVWGPAPGQEKIFKAYFSSCCGGITQSASDAFGDPYIDPLGDQNNHGICNASPKFNWGPVAVTKEELTRRFHLWAERKSKLEGKPRAELNMALVTDIRITQPNRWGRPTRFSVVDARENVYSWSGEELRTAVNTDAPRDAILYSSFFKIINDPGGPIRFVEGHGFGHGVGMCQWCAQRRAEEGMRHEDIVMAAFQHAKLMKAYDY